MTEKKRSIAEVSENTLKLEEYLKGFSPGTELSFSQIEHDTGINVNNDYHGRGYLRTASKRAGIILISKRGYGVEIASKETGTGVVDHRFYKIDNAIKKAENVHETIYHQFYEQMTPEQQKHLTYVGAIFGAIRLSAEHGKKLYSRKRMSIPSAITIPLPQFPLPDDPESR